MAQDFCPGARLRRRTVARLQSTDNSSRSQYGKMSLFHPREGGPHHDIQLGILPAPAGCSRVGLRDRLCLAPRSSQGRTATPVKPVQPHRKRSIDPQTLYRRYPHTPVRGM